MNSSFEQYLNTDPDFEGRENDDKMFAETIEKDREELSEHLKLNGCRDMGMLGADSTKDDSRKTLDCIYGLFKKWKTECESKKTLMNRNTLLEKERMNMENDLERTTKQRDDLQRRFDSLMNKLKMNEKQSKAKLTEVGGDLEEFKKSNVELKHKITQLSHENKKKEKELNKLKGQVRLFDKKENLRNEMELTAPKGGNGMRFRPRQAENEFQSLTSKAYTDARNALTAENADL